VKQITGDDFKAVGDRLRQMIKDNALGCNTIPEMLAMATILENNGEEFGVLMRQKAIEEAKRAGPELTVQSGL
jgi:hypothetical protein